MRQTEPKKIYIWVNSSIEEYILLGDGVDRFNESVMTGNYNGFVDYTTYWNISTVATDAANCRVFTFDKKIVGFEYTIDVNGGSNCSVNLGIGNAASAPYDRYSGRGGIWVLNNCLQFNNDYNSTVFSIDDYANGSGTRVLQNVSRPNPVTVTGELDGNTRNITLSNGNSYTVTNPYDNPNKLGFWGYRWGTGQVGKITALKVSLID